MFFERMQKTKIQISLHNITFDPELFCLLLDLYITLESGVKWEELWCFVRI